MKSFVPLGIAALLLSGTTALAQQHALDGARVRVLQKQHVAVTGLLRSISADSISVVDSAGKEHVLPRQDAALERSLGKHTKFWKHMGLTMGIAAGVGGLISAASWSECNDTGFLACFLEPESRSEAFAWGVAAGAVVGVPVGALLGAVVKVERWERVPVAGPLDGAGVWKDTRRFAISVALPAR